MSDIDLAISHCKTLEGLLEKNLGATGRGLHEKTSSVEARLPPDIVRHLRKVATIRNKIVHESDYRKIDDRDGFLHSCNAAQKALEKMGKVSGVRRLGRWALGIIVVLAILAWLVHRYI